VHLLTISVMLSKSLIRSGMFWLVLKNTVVDVYELQIFRMQVFTLLESTTICILVSGLVRVLQG